MEGGARADLARGAVEHSVQRTISAVFELWAAGGRLGQSHSARWPRGKATCPPHHARRRTTGPSRQLRLFTADLAFSRRAGGARRALHRRDRPARTHLGFDHLPADGAISADQWRIGAGRTALSRAGWVG